MNDKYIWVSESQDSKNNLSDILAGWDGQGGYNIAAMILFCEANKDAWEKYRFSEWLEDLKKR